MTLKLGQNKLVVLNPPKVVDSKYRDVIVYGFGDPSNSYFEATPSNFLTREDVYTSDLYQTKDVRISVISNVERWRMPHHKGGGSRTFTSMALI